MQIISRAQWGAIYPNGFGPAPLPAQEVWLHHSVTAVPNPTLAAEAAAMRHLEAIGQGRFGGGISYTFAVMPSGRVYEGHGVDRQGAHTANRNSIARAIVLVGDYSTRAPTVEQRLAVALLLQHGQATRWWRHRQLAGGHRQAPGASTACPGDAAQAVIPTINQLAAGGPIEEDDMAGEGPNILAAVMTGGESTRGIKLGPDGKLIYPTGVDPTSVLGRTADMQYAMTKALPILVAAAARAGDPLDIDTARVLISAAVRDAVDAAMPEALPADIDPADVEALAEAVKQKLAEALAGGQ